LRCSHHASRAVIDWGIKSAVDIRAAIDAL
jgi:hypothetical protein